MVTARRIQSTNQLFNRDIHKLIAKDKYIIIIVPIVYVMPTLTETILTNMKVTSDYKTA